jgi:hypothetical protein
VAIGALDRRWFIEKDRFALDNSRFPMTFVTRNFRMSAREREMRAGVVIKSRRNPTLDIVTLRASGLSRLRELGSVGLKVAVLTNL